MTCTPEIPRDESQEELITNLNDMPWYIGQPPSYANNCEHAATAEGCISNLQVFDTALPCDEIASIYQMPNSDHGRSCIEESRCLDILSLVKRASHSIHGINSYFNAFVNPDILHPLMVLAKCGSPAVQLCALRICCSLLFPNYHEEMIDHYNKFVGLVNGNNSSFFYFWSDSNCFLAEGRFEINSLR